MPRRNQAFPCRGRLAPSLELMLGVLRWLSFAWGCAALAGMVYFLAQWLAYGRNSASELLIGFMTFAFYGWPAWVGSPVLTMAQWRQLGPILRAVSLLPLVTALALYITARVLVRP